MRKYLFFLFFVFISSICFSQVNPSDISGLLFWLRADSNVVLHGDTVSTWGDCSGNNNNASQATITKQPLLINNQLNGKPIIRFATVNSNYLTFTNIPLINTTIFIVFNQTVGIGSIIGNTIDGADCILLNKTYPLWYMSFSTNGNDQAFSSPVIISTNHLLSIIQNNSTTSAYLDGSTMTVGGGDGQPVNPIFNSISYSSFGGYFNGDIAEIIIYNQALNTSDLHNIEQYLAYKYGGKVNLGSDVNSSLFCPISIDAGSQFSNYTWSTGATTQTINVDTGGIFSVTVTDIFGYTSSDTIKVTYPKVILHDTLFCSGASVSLSAGLGSSFSYSWSNSAITETINVSTPGSYWVTVSDNSASNCFKISNIITVIEDSFPTLASLGPDKNLCTGNSIGLVSPSPLPNGLTYSWSTSETTATISAAPVSASYSVTVTDTKGCVATDNISITNVGSAPPVDFTFSKGCSGATTQFNGISSLATSWSWDFGDGQSSILQTPSHTYATPNNYNVTLTVFNGPCSNSVTKTIHIPQPPVAGFIVDSACVSNNYPFNDQSSSSEGSIISWYWDFGYNGNHSHAKDTVYAYSLPGKYNITLTITSDSGCTNTFSDSITILSTALTPAPFSLYLPSNGLITSDHNINFAWNSSPNATSYTLEYSPDSLFITNVISRSNLTTTSLQENISTSQTYYWRVNAFNICGGMLRSNEQHFTIFPPSSISGLTLWYMGDSVRRNGLNVDTLIDCSGNNNHAIQAVITKQPTWVSNQLNGEPVISFASSNSNFLTFTNLPLTNTSIFMVFNQKGGGGGGGSIIGNTINAADCILLNGTYPLWYMSFTTNGYDQAFSSVVAINTNHLLSLIQRNSSTSAYLDGSTMAIGASDGQPVNPTFNAISYSSYGGYFNGDIAEIIIFNQALNTSNRRVVEKYLDCKYGAIVNLGPDIYSKNFCDTVLDASPRFIDYIWNSGETSSSITVKTGGTYSVTATDIFGFKSSDTVIVHKPTVNTHDTTVCLGDNVTLHTGLTAPFIFHWLPGNITTDSLVVTAPDTVTLTVYDTDSCFITKQIIVAADSFSVKASLGGTSINKCGGDSLHLIYGAGAATSYDWWDGIAHSFGSSYPIVWTTGNHPVTLTVTDTMGCVAVLPVTVIVLGAQPNVSFTYNPVCLNGGVASTGFDDTSVPVSGTLNLWHWNFGDGQSTTFLNSNAFNHAYDSAAYYNVTLTVSTNEGCSKSITQQVPVYSLPKPAFQPHLACSGVPLLIKDKSTSLIGKDSAWDWTINDPYNPQVILDTNAWHTFDSVGTYIIHLVVTTEFGCQDSIDDSIVVRKAPLVGFSYTSVCDGNPVYFSDTSITDPWATINQWHWNFGSGQTSNSQNPVFIFGNAGIHDVVLTVTSINGCTATDTEKVVVHAIPDAVFIPDEICAETQYTFHDSGTVAFPDSITSWLWDFGTAGTSIVADPVITFPDSGTVHVSLNVASNAGCSDAVSHTVHVNPVPIASFLPDIYYCVSPCSITFTNHSQGEINWLWNFGDTLGTSTQEDPTYTYTHNNPSTYTVTLTVYNQYGCSDSATQDIMVFPTVADIAVSNVQYVKQGNFLKLSADITNEGSQWVSDIDIYAKAAGSAVFKESWSDITDPLQPTETMNYTFNGQYELTDQQSTDYICVEAQIKNLVPDHDPANNEECITFTNQFVAFEPYPTPTHDQVHIDFILPFSGNVDIVLYGAKGDLVKKIFSGDAQKGLNKMLVDISSLSLGVYTYRITFRDNIKIMKFVKY